LVILEAIWLLFANFCYDFFNFVLWAPPLFGGESFCSMQLGSGNAEKDKDPFAKGPELRDEG